MFFGLYWVYVGSGVAVCPFVGVSLFWCVCGDVECLALGGVEVDWFVVLVAELVLDGFVECLESFVGEGFERGEMYFLEVAGALLHGVDGLVSVALFHVL